MSNIEQLKAFVFERLAATAEEIFGVVEKVIQDYGEKESRSRREIERQNRLLDIFLKPDVKLHRADPPLLPVCKEEVPHEQLERSPSLGQEDPEPLQIKEEQEETWTSQEGEQLQGLEEADNKDSIFTMTCLRSLHDQHHRQSPHLNQTVENGEGEPLPSTSTEQMKTEDDGEGCGVSEPTSDCQTLSSDYSVSESEDTDWDEDWTERGGPQSGVKTKTTKRQSSGIGSNGRKSMESYHLKPASQNAASCKVCGESFTSNDRFMQHVETHSKDAPCVCGVCGKHVESTESWVDHLESHKESKITLNPNSCNICNKEFSSSWYKAVHMRNHTGEKLHTCCVCSRKFTFKCNLTEHMLTHTGDKPHVCNVCGKGFSRVVRMKHHMRIHTGEKPHACSICSNKITSESCPTEHMNTHTGDRPHVCNVCGKEFIRVRNLNAHMIIHTGEKRVRNLNAHMIIHTGEKRHNCSVCGKGFKHLGNMQFHMRIHTGEKPYGCTHCGKTFTHGSYLSQHMRIHARDKTHI